MVGSSLTLQDPEAYRRPMHPYGTRAANVQVTSHQTLQARRLSLHQPNTYARPYLRAQRPSPTPPTPPSNPTTPTYVLRLRRRTIGSHEPPPSAMGSTPPASGYARGEQGGCCAAKTLTHCEVHLQRDVSRLVKQLCLQTAVRLGDQQTMRQLEQRQLVVEMRSLAGSDVVYVRQDIGECGFGGGRCRGYLSRKKIAGCILKYFISPSNV